MAITNDQESAGTIWVTSIVSGQSFEPLVVIEWGNQRAQLRTKEARAHAMQLLEAAEAAESDAFVFHWLMRDAVNDKNAENLERIMSDFQQFREARRNVENDDELREN